MVPFLRKVKTSSGATAVQIVCKQDGRNRVLEHLGSAHSAVELASLMEVGRQKLNPGQEELELFNAVGDPDPVVGVITSKTS